jgi:NAD(P)-dependent dehydrogenase (short-subunit alcohol dehydrogenase family)/acyl carrier protein
LFMNAFGFIVSNSPDTPDYGVALAAIRAGAIGVLNCAAMSDAETVRQALAHMDRSAHGPCGVKVDVSSPLAGAILERLPAAAEWVILTGPRAVRSASGRRVLVEVTSAGGAARAVALGCDGLIARGQALAKELASQAKIPVWVTGIGPESAAACQAAGVAGVLIETTGSVDALLQSWRDALTAAAPLETVITQFQQLMAQFLETQEAVMQAYLAGTAPSPQPLAPLPQAALPPAPLPQAALPPAPLPQAALPLAPLPQAALLRIVSQRTGYPPEALDPDAVMDADLGIDSVKRMEILTSFQQLCTAEGQRKLQEAMEQLTAARTLRALTERITAVLPMAALAGPASVAPPRDAAADLLRIASECTGYPPEMLDPDASLEAALGIDSLKRLEILRAFQKLRPAIEQKKIQAIMDTLTGARTLREMADRLAAVLPGASPKHARPSGAPPASDARPVPRFVLTVTAKPRRRVKPQYYPGRISIITDDENGIAAGIAHELNRAGEHAFLLRHNPDTVFVDDDLVTADLRDAAAVESAIGLIRQEYGPIGAVIHLLPLRANTSGAPGGFAEWRELMQLDVRSLYALARATEADLKQAGRTRGALFAAVTGRGGDFGLHPNPQAPPTHYAVADFTKTLALEFTGVLSKVVDVDATDPVRILREKLIDELTSADETLQVGLPGDRRLTIVPQAEPFSMRTARQIQRDWVILLTGGARGITAEIARGLAERCQPALVLVGASPLPAASEPADTAGLTEPVQLKAALMARLKASGADARPAAVDAACLRLMKDREIRRTLETLRRIGARVAYHSVDVRNQAAFGELIDSIYRDYGRLDAVIHGAGVIEDKLLRDKTPESFDRVVDTKADSTFLLSRKLRPESLQCLLFMSSLTAAFGNRAQADYAAADGVMNGFAARLAAEWPGRVVSLNWGPWDQTGMVSAEVRQQFLARSVPLIPLAGGAEAALREMEAAPPHDALVAFGEGPWSKTAVPAGTPRLELQAFGSMS